MDPNDNSQNSGEEFNQDDFIDRCNELTDEIAELEGSKKHSEIKRRFELLKELETWLESNYLDCDADTKSEVKKLLNETKKDLAETEPLTQQPPLRSLKRQSQAPDPDPEADPDNQPDPKPDQTNSSGTQTGKSNTTKTGRQESGGNQPGENQRKITLM